MAPHCLQNGNHGVSCLTFRDMWLHKQIFRTHSRRDRDSADSESASHSPPPSVRGRALDRRGHRQKVRHPDIMGPEPTAAWRLKLSDDAALHYGVSAFVIRARCRKRSAVETGVSHAVQPKKLPVEGLVGCAGALDLERRSTRLQSAQKYSPGRKRAARRYHKGDQ